METNCFDFSCSHATELTKFLGGKWVKLDFSHSTVEMRHGADTEQSSHIEVLKQMKQVQNVKSHDLNSVLDISVISSHHKVSIQVNSAVVSS